MRTILILVGLFVPNGNCNIFLFRVAPFATFVHLWCISAFKILSKIILQEECQHKPRKVHYMYPQNCSNLMLFVHLNYEFGDLVILPSRLVGLFVELSEYWEWGDNMFEDNLFMVWKYWELLNFLLNEKINLEYFCLQMLDIFRQNKES